MDRTAAADALLSRGADISAANNMGMTPLHFAVHVAVRRSETDAELVELLLARGAPINAVRDNGATPLHVAAYVGHPEIAALLLARGADVNAVAKDGTPLDLAYDSKNQKLIELLREHGAIRATEKPQEARVNEARLPTVPAGSCGV